MIFKREGFSGLTKMSISIILGVLIIIGFAIYSFVEIAERVIESEPLMIDEFVFNVMGSFDQSWLASVMAIITEAGSVTWLTIASVILTIYLLFISDKSKWVAVYFMIDIVGVSLLTQVLKLVFARERPDILEQYDGTGFSFPSGHSTGSFAFYGFLIYIIFMSKMNSALKWVVNSCLVVLILLVGLSRVYLDVHFFSDVLAGFSFGLAWLALCILSLKITTR